MRTRSTAAHRDSVAECARRTEPEAEGRDAREEKAPQQAVANKREILLVVAVIVIVVSMIASHLGCASVPLHLTANIVAILATLVALMEISDLL